MHELLQEYGNALSSDAQYDRSYTAPKVISAVPVVTFAPSLILRKRGNDGLIGLVEAIIQNIEDGANIPPAVLQQVCIVDQHENRNSNGDDETFREDDEIYFPLPANREQQRIVEHLTHANGIVVEGPPGTGKSLTIANLICHLLATGKRVLVTSHTARALQVLRDKIPEPIRPLCVQALSNDAKGMQALEFSVKGVTDRHLTWNPDTAQVDINRLDKELTAVRERLQKAIYDQRSIREAEVFRHDAITGVYSGTLAEIARRLNSEEEQLGIIRDEIHADHIPQCLVEEFCELLSILETDQDQLSDAEAKEPPDVSDLMNPYQFEKLVNELSNLETAITVHEGNVHKELCIRLNELIAETRRKLAANIHAFDLRMRKLRKERTESWLEEAIRDIFGERDRSWRGRLKDSQERLEALRNLPPEVLEARIIGHEQHDPDTLWHEANTLLEYLQDRKGKSVGFRLLLPRQVKTALNMLENVRVNGEPCTYHRPVEILVYWTKAARLLDSLDKEWEPVENFPERAFCRRIERYEDVCEPLTELLNLFEYARKLSGALSNICGDSGPVWHDECDLHDYLGAFTCADTVEQLESKKQEWNERVNLIQATFKRIPDFPHRDAFETAVAKRDVDKYRHTYEALEELRKQWERTYVASKTLRSLSKAAPILVGELQKQPADPKWRVLAERWDAAWAWATTRTWLREMVAPDADKKAATRVDNEQKRIQDLLAQLASARAWTYCFERLTEEQRTHLQAWSLAVRKIGKGTGKYANQHRQAARGHIGHCQPAIPAWIMPMYRVAESIRPDQVRFDVAIIDEASQSGPEALALLFLAEKIIVVGDDKQISPDPFTRVEEVNRLRREFISDLPTNDALDPQNSFFDLAKIRYPARIRLVEHFRCMPEIIQFSNELCYKAEPLIPLRQFGAGRLEPVVNVVHVPTGFTKGKVQKVNQPEATAVARKIAELLRDKRYDGKTFGVISLLGDRHAQRIQTELLSLVDPREQNARSLICGDAYDFQGAERDVMFLSMVAAPGSDSRIGVLAKASDERRFNVAMSRAKDQVWLFHSATLNDLSPKDLRFQLLRYCQNPSCKSQTIRGIDIEDIAKQARSANRSADKPPGVFGSWFEIDVFLKIANEGYLVVPQYEVSGYFIDFAVIGRNGKLAVECDGEYWHGPEEWENDAARQRDLERCGWPFFRLRESTFYLDPARALEPLWGELKKQGIRPSGANDEPEPGFTMSCISESEIDGSTEETDYSTLGSFDEGDGFDGQDPTLPGYVEWEPHPIPNPRSASRESMILALIEIVQTEGPATWRRVFDRYRLGLDLGRLKGPTRETLEVAARLAVRTGQLLEWREIDSEDWYDGIVRVPGTELVRLRQRGPRNLADVPPSEIVELMRIRQFLAPSEEWVLRQILASYGLRRLTEDAKSHLLLAAQMVSNQSAAE